MLRDTGGRVVWSDVSWQWRPLRAADASQPVLLRVWRPGRLFPSSHSQSKQQLVPQRSDAALPPRRCVRGIGT
jgi:hypothetical protein